MVPQSRFTLRLEARWTDPILGIPLPPSLLFLAKLSRSLRRGVVPVEVSCYKMRALLPHTNEDVPLAVTYSSTQVTSTVTHANPLAANSVKSNGT